MSEMPPRPDFSRPPPPPPQYPPPPTTYIPRVVYEAQAPTGIPPAQPWEGMPAPVAPKPKMSGNRKLALVIGGGVLVGAIATVVIWATGGFGGYSQHSLTIHYGLIDYEDGGNCETGGTDGYSDVAPGMPVTVRDEKNDVIASTSLPDHGFEHAGVDVGCVWTMKVMVPDDAQQYQIEGGRRGTVTYSHAEVVGDKWTVEITLGGND